VERFSQEIDPLKRKALAEEMQMRVIENAPEVSLGQFSPPGALRANVRGWNGLNVPKNNTGGPMGRPVCA